VFEKARQLQSSVAGRDISITDDDLIIFLGVLLGGLFVVTPILKIYFGVPSVVTVGLVGLAYGMIALRRRALLYAGLVSVIVTSTFAANIPLASGQVLESMPGDIGPEVYFIHATILGTYAVAAAVDRDGLRNSWGIESSLFVGFVLWVAAGAVLAAPPRPDVVLYYALFLLTGLLAFQLLKYAVSNDILGFQSAILVLFLTIVAHLCYSAIQFFNQDTFDVSQLGEPNSPRVLAELQLGPLGVWDIGTFVTGFAGFTFHIAALAVLIAALPFAYYLVHQELGKYTLPVTILAAGIVRTTASDAARGALLITVIFASVALFVLPRLDQARLLSLPPVTPTKKLRPLAICVGTFLVTLIPSSKSGSASHIQGSAASGSSSSSAASSGDVTVEAVADPLGSVTVPFFDLSNLTIRLQQYVLGIDLFSSNPIVGIGAGNFMFYGAAASPDLFREMHNLYLAVLVETGLVGFMLYFGVIGLVVYRGIGAIWNDISPRDSIILIALSAGLLGQFAIGVFDSTQLIKITVFVPFWITLGAIAGLSSGRDSSMSALN